MKRFGILFTCTTLLASAAYADKPMDRKAVEKIIEEYLLEHPEVILEAVSGYQEKQQAEMQKQASAALKGVEDDVFNNPDTPAYGSKNGVKVVEFFDYNCSACKMMFQNLQAYLEEENDVRLLFKEFPIFDNIPGSRYASEVAIAINRIEPDKYFEYHTAMMTHQGTADVAAVDEVVKTLGLNLDKVKAEAKSTKVQKILDENAALAARLGARGTPMVIIGDEVIPHALSLPDLVQRVQNAKQAKK